MSSITPKSLAAAVRTTAFTYSVNDTVYESGAPARFVYVVKKGSVRRLKILSGGRRLILQFLFPGDSFGYGIARLHHDTVQVLTSTELVVASKKALMTAAMSDARLSNLLFEAAARALDVAEATALMRSGLATERTALFLLEMHARLSTRDGRINLPMTRRDISDYLGLTVETVSRTLNGFQRAKIIQFQGSKRQRRVVIRDRKRLQRLASDASNFGWWKH